MKKFIHATWVDEYGEKHEGIYFKNSKKELIRKLKFWKNKKKIKSYTLKETNKFI